MSPLDSNLGSKSKLIDAAIELLSTKGFHSSGINEILELAKVTKSNFYYHFKSKEELCLEAFDVLAQGFIQKVLRLTILNSELTPLARFEHFFQQMIQILEVNFCQKGCPFVNLATETSDFYPAFRKKTDHFFHQYQQALESCYREGVECGEFREDLSPKQIAFFILSSINGSLVLVKTLKNTEVLKQNVEVLFTLIAPVRPVLSSEKRVL